MANSHFQPPPISSEQPFWKRRWVILVATVLLTAVVGSFTDEIVSYFLNSEGDQSKPTVTQNEAVAAQQEKDRQTKVASEKVTAEKAAAVERDGISPVKRGPNVPPDGFTSLFNGKTLDGWINVNCKRNTFSVRNGVLYCNGSADGFIRTERQYTNFILEVDWRHLENKGNSGLFIWCGAEPHPGATSPTAVEVQILAGYRSPSVTSHGDIHPINGAFMVPDRPPPTGGMRCLPSEHRCHPTGQWNNYRLSCTDGTIKLTVNGKEVSGGSQALPRSGYIGLQSKGSSVEFRNIRLRESLSGKSN